MRNKNSSGFTLVELIVAIAASALVVGAAASFMLFGLRMEKTASDDASVQSNSRIIMRVLENIAAEGDIGEIRLDETSDSVVWQLFEPDDNTAPILSFNSASQTINGKDYVVIIEDVAESTISYKNNLLSCTIKSTSGDEYTSSVYCRVGAGKVTLAEVSLEDEKDKTNDKLDEIVSADLMFEAESEARRAFLGIMFSQYGSGGTISDETIFNGYEFATWYWAINLQNNSDIWVNNPEKVPWCAIFVSWALNKTVAGDANGKIPQNLDALVDNVMWYQFGREPNSPLSVDEMNDEKNFSEEKRDKYLDNIANQRYAELGKWHFTKEETEINGKTEITSFIPNPGDIVFFENEAGNGRADHLGVFLYIEDNILYTIEGNNSDRVGIFAYPYKDGIYTDGISDVIGYGAINWAELGLVEEATADNEMSQ